MQYDRYLHRRQCDAFCLTAKLFGYVSTATTDATPHIYHLQMTDHLQGGSAPAVAGAEALYVSHMHIFCRLEHCIALTLSCSCSAESYEHKHASQLDVYLCCFINSSPPEGLIDHVNLSFQIGFIGTILWVIACNESCSQ